MLPPPTEPTTPKQHCPVRRGWRATRGSRRGATLVETAVVLSVFLLLILGTLDLGIATFRYNTLSQAARQGVRQAVVHGALAEPALSEWGPNTYTGTAADGSEQAQAVFPLLAGFRRSDVTIRVEWIDGGNNIQQRVRYSLSTPYRPIVSSFFSQGSYTLRAASTMPITH